MTTETQTEKRRKSYDSWLQRANAIDFRPFENSAFINNQFAAAVDGKTYKKATPYKQNQQIEIASCQARDVDLAVEAAKNAFDKGIWKNMPAKVRKKKLLRFVEALERNKEELALLETIDMGKPISYSLSEDARSGIDHFQWMAECIDKLYDEISPAHQDFIGMIVREPSGVVAAIVPWNYPFMMMSWKVAPALATGNSVILKPSEKSPLTALFCARLWQEADLPPGVFNVLPGFGDTAGAALSYHPEISVLVFTGSTATGKKLLLAAGESNMKRVWLEAGGKSPSLVFPDANLEKAVKTIASSIFYNQGAVCIASSRLIVHKSIKEKLMESLVKEASSWFPEHPLNPDANMGAIVDSTQYHRIQKYIELGKKEACAVALESASSFSATKEYAEGLYIPPTIFDKVETKAIIAQEEIFGPVLAVLTAENDEEMLTLANDTPFGLGASIWTKDIMKANAIARDIHSGSVWINCWGDGDATIPFGGMKQSGYGRDKSFHAFDKYTDFKAIVLGK